MVRWRYRFIVGLIWLAVAVAGMVLISVGVALARQTKDPATP